MASGLSTYQQINDAVVQLVCQLFTNRSYDQLTEIGIPYEIAEKLVRQNQLVMNRLTNYKSPLMQLHVDSETISNLVDHLEQESEKDHLINNMIINGAPSEMVTSTWGIDEPEYFRRKKSLDLRFDTGPGRLPKSLRKKEDEKRITRFMNVFQTSTLTDPGWRLIEASTQTNVPLHLVWVYMREHLGNTDIGNDTWNDLMHRPVMLWP